MKFDVVIRTKNSAKTLKKCLSSITKNLPYKNIIMVDGGSTDDTEKIAMSYKRVKFFDVSEETEFLSIQTKLGADKVTTKWFFIVDSDIIVQKDTFKQIKKYMKDAQAIACIQIPSDPHYEKVWRYFMLRRTDAWFNFGCALIKTEVFKEYDPPEVYAHEDGVFFDFVKKQGYKYVVTPIEVTQMRQYTPIAISS